MSAATSEWPAWLRGRTAVELLGPPGRFFAWVTIALSLLAIVYVGGWNAAKYPIVLGYDAQPNAAYAHILLDQHHIPGPDQSGEARQPPGYYFVGEVAARGGHELFGWLEARPYSAQLPEASYRGAQILNVALVFATALIVLALARMVAPTRPEVWAGSVAFFAFLPVVAKTAAMFHPETLNMFLSAAAVLIATRIATSRRLTPIPMALLTVTLLAGFLVRSSTLFTLIAVVIGLAITFASSAARPSLSRRSGIVALVALAGVSVVGLLLVTRAPDLTRGLTHFGGQSGAAGRASFFRLDIGSLFQTPYRPHFVNQALPMTYAEIWGDWIGAFAWDPSSTVPSPKALSVLQDQNWIGVIPTMLAIGGWLRLTWVAAKRRRELASLAVFPLVVVGGYLARSYQLTTSDGDLLKATYALTSAPAWAVGFGLGLAMLRRFRIVWLVAVACLAVFAVLDLRFMMYGVRDGLRIF